MTQSQRLAVVLTLNILLIAGLVVVGLTAHSLGVLAAGGDSVADSLAIGLGLFAIRVRERSGGNSKATTRVAAVNATLLLLITGGVAVEGIRRLLAGSPEVNGLPVLIASTVTMVVIAVFQQFSKAIHQSRREFVVVDTAPTGHTLLLLDATGSYHRDVTRQMGESAHLTTPLMRLQDPRQTKIILVTLAEPTPVAEARGLHGDLERAGIHPWAWVVNNSMLAAHPDSPFLRTRARAETGQIRDVETFADRVAIVPLLAQEPVGQELLTALVEGAVAAPVG